MLRRESAGNEKYCDGEMLGRKNLGRKKAGNGKSWKGKNWEGKKPIKKKAGDEMHIRRNV